MVIPSGRHSAGAVDLRSVVQVAGRLIDSGKGEEGGPVRGVRFCKVYDIARRACIGCACFWAKRTQCVSLLEPCRCMEVDV